MKISITDKAREYIKGRGGEIVVSTVVAKGCCGAAVREPAISVRLPKEIQNYRKLENDGITIYIPPKLEIGENGIMIKMGGLWKLKYLIVEGVKTLL